MNEREKVIEELKLNRSEEYCAEDIADFVIAERLKIAKHVLAGEIRARILRKEEI